jgi:hypothetical protein
MNMERKSFLWGFGFGMASTLILAFLVQQSNKIHYTQVGQAPKSQQEEVVISQPEKSEPATTTRPNREFVVGYESPDGNTYEVVVNKLSGEVFLRERIDLNDTIGVGGLTNHLEQEVSRLVLTKRPVPLGKSGLSLNFFGLYPKWNYRGGVSDDDHWLNEVNFAYVGYVEDSGITCYGHFERPVGEYPFSDSVVADFHKGRRF